MSIYFCNNITIQWCLVAESLYNAGHPSGTHGFGGIWGSNYGTSHHNLLAHHSSRNPRMASGIGYFDYRNNVIYNWGYNSCYGGENQQVGDPPRNFSTINMVANYYKPGPATEPGQVTYRIANPSYRTVKTDYGQWYVTNNVVVNNGTVTADNWKGGIYPQGGFSDTNLVKLANPWPAMAIAQQTAEEAYSNVLDHVGASLPKRDPVDARIVDETRNGYATYEGATYETQHTVPNASLKCGIIDSTADVGGWPVLMSTTPPIDTDHDGMPDDWEILHGLDPNNAADRNGDFDNDGFSNLEEYLNELGAFKAVRDIVWTGSTNNRYARIENWDIPFQPSRLDTAIISNATVFVDAIGQHAGILRLTNNATLNITNGWLNVATLFENGTGCTTTVSTAGSLITSNLVNNGMLRLTGAAGLNVSGTFTNTGTLDVMTWSGTLPDGLVNTGTILDRSLIRITDVSPSGTDFQVTIQGYTGHNYQLQYRDEIATGTWQNVGSPVAGADAPITFTHTNGAAGDQRFYQVSVD